MSFISDLFGGGDAADAAVQAGNIQADASNKAAEIGVQTAREQIAAQKESLGQIRSDLQPFRDVGASEIPVLRRDIANISALANDQNQQKSYIENNPFFKMLADDAQSRLFSNQAAKGKVGSGGTAQALQNSILLLGQDLLNQDLSRKNTALGNRFNLTTLGQNAAAGQGTATQNTANNIANLAMGGANALTAGMTGGANAQAAGIVGAANAKTGAMNSAINTGMQAASLFMLSDRRMKTHIKKIGEDAEGMNVYSFRYKGDDTPRIGHMAQEMEEIHPEAVKTINGVKFIDYGAIHHAN